MSKQRTLIALDWLMPVLQDIFDEQNYLLHRDDVPMDWESLGQSLHQVSGALTLTNQYLLAELAGALEQVSDVIAKGEIADGSVFENGQTAKKNIIQAVHLLQYEIQQLQRKQQIHEPWVVDRIGFLYESIGQAKPDLSKIIGYHADNTQDTDAYLPLLSKLPTPNISKDWQDDNVQHLTKLWRYCTLQLLQQQKNDVKSLETLAKIANYLAATPLNATFRQVWHLVALWFGSLALNDKPTPEQYVIFLSNLEALLQQNTDKVPDFDTGRLAVDILLHLSRLGNKTEPAEALLNSLDLNDKFENDTLFSQVLEKLEKAIYQVYEPATILPILDNVKVALVNRGWMFYGHHLDVIINDVKMMIDDANMASSLAWQVERQLQDLYSQLLSTAETLDSQIGLHHFSYASDPEHEAVRQTRIYLENVKCQFNEYTKLHDLAHLHVNDELVSMVQVFGLLGLNRPKELAEQLRILLSRIVSKNVAVLSWDATDAIAEMIARFELFLDYLSHQSVSEELLDQTQAQLNRANLLVKNLIDMPMSESALPSRDKVFENNTVIYDDEGEKIANQQANQVDTAQPTAETFTSADENVSSDDDVIFDDDDIVFDDEPDETQNTQEIVETITKADEATDTDVENVTNASVQNMPVAESEALIQVREALKPDDFEMADEEIREIFIEEADEVLQEMDSNLPVWQADPSDLKTLKEIRRGFHTLKGSGRMVGAYQIGEMAWAVENMLNRVLDGTLSSSDELAQFIGETRQKIPTLVNDFAQMQAPSLDPAITVLQANNILAGKPINTGLNLQSNTVSTQPTVAEVAVQPEFTEQDFTEQLVITDSDDNHAEQSTPMVATQSVDKLATDGLLIDNLPEPVKQAYDELNEVADGESDPDIQEIFIEEAQEVLETIQPLYAEWKAEPSDMTTLKELRRGFHTLKGSGRMVGANQLGELAWSIENMLNRVMDNTITPETGLVALVGDVLADFHALVDIFAQGRNDYPQIIKVWSAIANAYAKKQGANFDYPTTMQSVLGGSVSQSVTDENTKTPTANVDDNQQIDDDKILDDEIDDSITDSTVATHDTDDVSLDDNEKVAMTVFLEEAQELTTKIDNFINTHANQDQVKVTDELVRAFHTLRGGAAIFKLSRVQALSEMLENGLSELLRKEIALNAEQLEILQQVKAHLQDDLNNAYHLSNVALNDDDQQSLENYHQQLFGDVHTANAISVSELLTLGIDELIDADNSLLEIFVSEDDTQIVSYAQLLESQAEKLVNAIGGLSYVSIAETLQLAYHKLTIYPHFTKDDALLNGLINLHAQLIAMFDAIAAGLNVFVDKQSIEGVKQLLADKQYQAEMDAIQYEKIDTDIELLEIFLAESQELRLSLQSNFNQWQNNLTNTDTLKELCREYHTLKGGASMVGIVSIANLAKYAELMYDALLSEKLASDPDIVLVMQKVHETTYAQLQYAIQHQQSFFANDLTVQLSQILSGKLLAHDVVPAVPLIVDVRQDEADNAYEVDETDEANANRNADPLYVQEIINNFEQRRLETWQGQEPDEDILGVYLEEAKELIDSSSQNLQEFRSNTNNLSALQALQRELHTIKGGARMVGAEGIANLAHEMETIYEELGSRRKPATRMIGNLLASCHDWLASSLYVLENKYNPQTPTTLIRALQDFSHNPDSLKEVPVISLASQIEQIDIYKSSLNQEDDGNKRDLTVMPSMESNFETEQEQVNLNAEMLRISAGLMERMINLSGESAINRARIEMGVSSLTHTIEEMGSTVQRLADQLRRMETELEVQILAQIADEHSDDADFDPLEMDQYSALNQLSKSLSESASDLVDIKATMLDKTRDTENLLLQLSRTQADLQEGLMNSRTVPFSRITARLQRIVRQTATELGKSVELRILNDEGEIDRNILERITSPLEHMLRNAVDHGIEKSQERIEAGKSRTGLITLEVQREGGEIVIHLSDDGKGINVDAVRKKAVEQGLIAKDDTSLKPLDIMQYIFNAGLSTAKTVSQISGRGVGMDVVQSEVKQLGGVVLVDSELGKGSRFTMRLPLTVAVSDALVVRAGDKYYAVPLVQIERVLRINTETVYQFHSLDATTLNIDGQDYRLRYLNQILHGSDPLEALSQQPVSVPVIIIRTETGQNMALQVDAIAGSRIEVVVKPLGPQLSHISGISAATIMGDGSVMLILDLIALMRNASATVKIDRQKTATKDANRKPVVLIIDDSVTVRKVTSRLLERNGYEAQVATDGVDALEKLQELTPDIMLLDIEMPRMDGFEVAAQVRHNERLRNIPIIMITSRTGEKHRERAMSIGVNEYKGKPFQEQDLLDTLARLIHEKTVS